MSSLQRYRRSGGFTQLVSLIETFGVSKRDKFLEMIEAESPSWAGALREKMLTIERVSTWPDDALATILKSLPLKTQAYVLMGVDAELKNRLHAMLSGSERRRLDDVLDENKPKPDELSSVVTKFIEVARRMLTDRDLLAERIDKTLAIANDLEAKLDGEDATDVGIGTGAPGGAADADVARRLAVSLKENKSLKEEVRALKDRLDQIRRIA